MKTVIFILIAVLMTASMAMATNTDPKTPGDGSNSKLKTTVRCGSERGVRPKKATVTVAKNHYKPYAKGGKPGKFAKKKYGQKKVHR